MSSAAILPETTASPAVLPTNHATVAESTAVQSSMVSAYQAVNRIPPGKVMIVDDEIANVLVVKKHLERAGYESFETTTDSTAAMELIRRTAPDVLLLDINMPKISGLDILREIRLDRSMTSLPVLILTANTEQSVKLQCLDLGATDFLLKPVEAVDLVPRVRNALILRGHQRKLETYAQELEAKVRERTLELEQAHREAIYCLARAAEMRDNDTGYHVIRVGRYAGIIAKQLGCQPWFVRDIEVAAQLHDVGKIAIPDAILQKPGRLEPEEFDVIQSHVKLGHQIIQPYVERDAERLREHVILGSDMLHAGEARPAGCTLMQLAGSIAQSHHEKFDGSGYPLGLAGEDIPLEGRVVAVADVYDALSAERVYKKALPREKCFEILQEGRGEHFDPKVLDAFFSASREIIDVQLQYMDH
ncbi:MAG: HD domain-containing phosphohydrolase [Planctomycetota bacterium]